VHPPSRLRKAAAPALIVFAREPIPGRTKTRLIPRLGAAGAARMAAAFVMDTVAKAATFRGSTLVIAGSAPVAVHQSEYFLGLAQRFGCALIDQGEGDLGRRMAQVLARYADAPGAVLIGTDMPTLPASFIRQAMEDLRDAPVVIAPALDGGYYLVGVRETVPAIFTGIKWGGPRVMEETTRRLRRLGIPYRIGRWWYDIDNPADLDFLAADLAGGVCSANGYRACPATARLMRELGLLKAGC
jgi:rSAM/selenodomain-associated transferase 1